VNRREVKKENDRLIRELVRKRRFCEKCGRCPREGEVFDDDHVFSRTTDGTRWMPEAHLLLCQTCHRWVKHSNAGRNTEIIFHEWFKEKYPERWAVIEPVLYKVNKMNVWEVNEFLRSKLV
jgi:5-methylcytosine-specific restriction endonuclease McrA